ncbi:MAG: DNA-binding protein WhiA [Tissierellia bacterium]|nr:DNA-binding protein WhiA [Tissierellia bacterium]
MSFSSSTKNELSRIPIVDDCCALGELAALVRMNVTIKISRNNEIVLKFTTENAAIARRIFSLIKHIYDTSIEVLVRRNKQLKKNNNYLVVVNEGDIPKRILEDVKFVTETTSYFNPNYAIPEDIVTNRCCKRSYIRGAFLGGGSITNPEKTYHLEFVTSSEVHAKDLSDLINTFGLNSKIVLRKDNYVVYIKEGEQIVDLLNIIGAHQALLKLEDIRVLKNVRNNINRLVNCETANLSKTIDASMKQIENIKLIEETIGMDKLPQSLREIAELRLQYREASLKELGSMLNPPVSKSGVNHRFRKIEKIAEDLRGDGKNV